MTYLSSSSQIHCPQHSVLVSLVALPQSPHRRFETAVLLAPLSFPRGFLALVIGCPLLESRVYPWARRRRRSWSGRNDAPALELEEACRTRADVHDGVVRRFQPNAEQRPMELVESGPLVAPRPTGNTAEVRRLPHRAVAGLRLYRVPLAPGTEELRADHALIESNIVGHENLGLRQGRGKSVEGAA